MLQAHHAVASLPQGPASAHFARELLEDLTGKYSEIRIWC